MSGSSGGEKTEDPTAKKLQEARDNGQTSRTPDLAAWLGVLAATLLLPGTLQGTMDLGTGMLADVVDIVQDPEPAKALALLRASFTEAAVVLAPLVLTLPLVAVAATGLQGGIHLAKKKLKPDFKHLNPAPGVKRMVGPQAWWEAAKALIKVGVLAAVLWYVAGTTVPGLVSAGVLPVGTTVTFVTDEALHLMQVAAGAGLLVAVGDYAVVKRRTMKQLRMTKEEVKQEHKNSEGDPMLKGAIKSKQLAMSRNRMMSDVAEADTVLVNPTHIAVALKYDPEKGAPRVVAKGQGLIATRIRQIAAENAVPIVQDVPLARALHRSCEVGTPVPTELYTAVARVLAFVMRLRTAGLASTAPGAEPVLHRVPEPRKNPVAASR